MFTDLEVNSKVEKHRVLPWTVIALKSTRRVTGTCPVLRLRLFSAETCVLQASKQGNGKIHVSRWKLRQPESSQDTGCRRCRLRWSNLGLSGWIHKVPGEVQVQCEFSLFLSNSRAFWIQFLLYCLDLFYKLILFPLLYNLLLGFFFFFIWTLAFSDDIN